MARIRYLYFRPIFQLLSQLCGGGTWLTKAVPTSTAKKPKEVMHFRVWNVTRSGNFFMGVAVCSRQKPNRLLNQYDKKIHSSIFWTFSNLSPQEHCLHSGILLPKLFWSTLRKKILVINKNFWNSRLKTENLHNFLNHMNNLFKLWKVRTILETELLF